MREFLSHPIWQFLSVILAVSSIIFSFWVYWRQRQIKELVFGPISSRRLLSISDELSSRVKVELDGKPVSNLHLLVYALKNSGHRAILPTDFQNELNISFEKGTVVSAEITAQYPNNLNASIDISETKVALRPLLLNAGDQLQIQILVSASELNANIDARILDISKLESINTNPKYPPVRESMLPHFFGIIIFFAIASYLIHVNDWWHYLDPKIHAADFDDRPFPPYAFPIFALIFGFIQVSLMRLNQSYGPSSRRYIDEHGQ